MRNRYLGFVNSIIPQIKSLFIEKYQMGNFLPSFLQRPEIIIMSSVEEVTKLFMKDTIIVWHDPEVNSRENQQYKDKLKTISEVKTFSGWKEASQFIMTSGLPCQVITAGTNGEDFAKEIIKHPNVISIHVFCRAIEKHTMWAQNIQKVAGVKNQFSEIWRNIEQELLNWQKQDSSLRAFPNFAPIFNDTDKDELIYQHLNLRGLIHFQNRAQGKKDFLNLAKAIYKDKKNMKDFEKNYKEYDMKSILTWYTKQSFFYKTTNNCLRISTPDSIQYCRLALKDIETAIKEQYSQQSKDFNGLLYRGAYMSDDEWKQIERNIGKEIEMLGFLSTSKSKKVAVDFLSQDISKKILITIIVPNLPFDKGAQGFAEMKEFSVYKTEEEILFNIMSRFRILETRDETLPGGMTCRHAVLLYGSEAIKQSMTTDESMIEVFIKDFSEVTCEECKEKITPTEGGMLSLDISDQNKAVCKKCLDPYQKKNKPTLLHYTFSNQQQHYLNLSIEGKTLKYKNNKVDIPFSGYKCSLCESPKFTSCYHCLSCKNVKKQWCQECNKLDHDCTKGGHLIIQENQPYTYWSEKLSELEMFFKKYQQEMVKVDNFFNQAQTFENTHNYEKAIEYYGMYLEENKGEKENEKKAIVYNNLARIYDKFSDNKNALEFYTKSFEIFQKMYGNRHPITASAYNNLGTIYDKLGDYKKALASHLNALEIYKTIKGNFRELMATSYSNIASAHSGLREYSEAVNYYLQALEMRAKIYGKEHPITATSYNNLGYTYHKLENLAQAKEYYTKALEIRKAIYGNKHPLVSASYTNLGVLFSDLGETKQAIEYFEMALKFNKAVYGDNHLDVASSYDNLGQVYYKMEQYRDANDYFLSALKIREKAGDDNKLLLAISYNNLGCAFNVLGVYNRAEEYHRKALENRKTISGERNLETATSENNLGIVYYNLSKYSEAEKLFSSALETRRALLGEQHPETITLYYNLGLVCEVLERYDQALEYHLKVVNNEKKLSNLTVASSYESLGLLYGMTEKYDDAIKFCLKSIEVYSTVSGGSSLKTANAHQNLGLVYEVMKLEEKALKEFLKALEIRKKIYGEESSEVAVSYNSLGRKYEFMGKYKQAIDFHQKALKIRISVFGEQNIETATSYHNLGLTFDMDKQSETAEKHLKKAHGIYRSLLGRNHSLTRMIDDYLSGPYEGRTESLHQRKEPEDKAKELTICIGGNARVGKSCFIERCLERPFIPEYNPTIGATFYSRTIEGFRMKFWDFSGDEKYRLLWSIYLKMAERGILMYTIDDRKSFEDVLAWKELFENNTPQGCQLILVANKKDVKDRVVSYEEGKMLAQRHGIPFFEVSAKLDENFDGIIDQILFSDEVKASKTENLNLKNPSWSRTQNLVPEERNLKSDFQRIVRKQLKKIIIK